MWTSTCNNATIRRGSNVLLVIAHPDDEAIFFAPLLIALKVSLCKVSILCLSTGDYDGLGLTRRIELLKSADCYGIDRDRVQIIDHHQLQDGKESYWSPELVRDIILNFLATADFDTVRRRSITFAHHDSFLETLINPNLIPFEGCHIRRKGGLRSSKSHCHVQGRAAASKGSASAEGKNLGPEIAKYKLCPQIPWNI